MTTSPKRGGNTLLLIDPQNDFHPGGSLAIESAGEDAERIADLIRRSSSLFDRIVVTLDSHHKLDIAHPCFWLSGEDNDRHPEPFTIITAEDIRSGKWKPRADLKFPRNTVDGSFLDDSTVQIRRDSGGNIDLVEYAVSYAEALEKKGRFQICVWPEHCLVGTDGHGVYPVIHDAMQDWVESTGKYVEYVMKGQNHLTENYSVFEAEVPINSKTSYNYELFDSLRGSDRIFVAGQAKSHCVNFTVRDLVKKWPKHELDKICLLTDCMSPVASFEQAGDEFVSFAKDVGVKVCSAADALNK